MKERQTDLERTSEIVIDNDCSIGGGGKHNIFTLRFVGSIINVNIIDNIQAHVLLGQRCTVGAGSIVIKSFPDRRVVSHDSESFVDLSIFVGVSL